MLTALGKAFVHLILAVSKIFGWFDCMSTAMLWTAQCCHYLYFYLIFFQPIGNISERFHALCMKDSGVLYEDPYIQVSFPFPLFSSLHPFLYSSFPSLEETSGWL